MPHSLLQHGSTRYTHFSIAYHLVWIPKYRSRIFSPDIQKKFKELVQQCCRRHQLILLEVETDQNHCHLFVSASPRLSPASIVNLLKGYTSRYLRLAFPHLKHICGQDHLWTQAYYVGTAGAVSADIIRRYISECQGT